MLVFEVIENDTVNCIGSICSIMSRVIILVLCMFYVGSMYVLRRFYLGST